MRTPVLCTPRQIASACKAGTDCGGCVRRIQALLGRGDCARRELLDQRQEPAVASVARPVLSDAALIGPTRPERSVGGQLSGCSISWAM